MGVVEKFLHALHARLCSAPPTFNIFLHLCKLYPVPGGMPFILRSYSAIRLYPVTVLSMHLQSEFMSLLYSLYAVSLPAFWSEFILSLFSPGVCCPRSSHCCCVCCTPFIYQPSGLSSSRPWRYAIHFVLVPCHLTLSHHCSLPVFAVRVHLIDIVFAVCRLFTSCLVRVYPVAFLSRRLHAVILLLLCSLYAIHFPAV